MSVKFVNNFRLKDSGALLLEDDLGASASLLIRHFVGTSTKATNRSVVYLNCLLGKCIRFTNVEPEFVHRVQVLSSGRSPKKSRGLLADEIEGLAEAFDAAHRQHGKPVVVVDSLNVLLGLFGLSKTVGFVHHVAIKHSWRLIAAVRTTPAVADDVAALERYAEGILRISLPVNFGGDGDAVLSSCEESLIVKWTQKSTTGSITSGVDLLTIDVKSASLVRREEVKQLAERFLQLETEPKEDAAAKTISSLTFKLSLSEGEKAARNVVDLPYLKAQDKAGDLPLKKPEAQIHYTPDIDDDYDEEDPDDDLNF